MGERARGGEGGELMGNTCECVCVKVWMFELPLLLAAHGFPVVEDAFVDIVSVSAWSLSGWFGGNVCRRAVMYVVVLVLSLSFSLLQRHCWREGVGEGRGGGGIFWFCFED